MAQNRHMAACVAKPASLCSSKGGDLTGSTATPQLPIFVDCHRAQPYRLDVLVCRHTTFWIAVTSLGGQLIAPSNVVVAGEWSRGWTTG